MLPMFLFGSFMTIGYYKLQKSALKDLIKKPIPQLVISILSILMFIFGFRIFSYYWRNNNFELIQLFLTEEHKNVSSGFYWAIFLFLMLIGHPNYLTSIFAESNVLKNFGKYSFGIYLLHPMFIKIFTHSYHADTGIEPLILIIACSYVAGVLFFYVLEDFLINLAYKLCKIIDSKVDAMQSKV